MENYKKQSLIKYHNNLNTVAFRKFKSTQMDIIYSICHLFQTHQDQVEFKLTPSFIRELANYRNATVKELLKDVEKTLIQFNACTIQSPTENKRIICFLFETVEINDDTNEIKIRLNEKFKWIIDELNKNFTIFKIEEIIRLKSKYSKILFPILMQWKSVGKYVVRIEDFREQLGIPNSYRITDIDTKVLQAIKTDFKKTSISNFNISKEYKGRKVNKIVFSFSPIVQISNGNIVPEWLSRKEESSQQLCIEEYPFDIFSNFEGE